MKRRRHSNLGGYQDMTTNAKRIGGPAGYHLFLIAVGIVLGIAIMAACIRFIP